MPFASATRPSLGLSILKATLERDGASCDVAYPNISFAATLGLARYERIARELPHPVLAGEWIFSGCLYDAAHGPVPTYVDDVLAGRWGLGQADIDLILEARDMAPWFVDDCLAAIAWHDYDVIGFASSCAQNIAALSLARRVKERCPDAAIVFGGSNWDEGMGAELHRRFGFVDFACSGEADVSLPALVHWLEDPRSEELAAIPGIAYRRDGASVATGPAAPVADLDGLPYPDYDDYFAVLRANRLTQAARPGVFVETCRGCWWAARRPCLFCGSPGCRRTYRAKSPGRVLAEVRALAARRNCRALEIVDDVPAPGFFDEVLPALAADPLPVPLFCEVRPEVTREHIRLLGLVRGSVQPGIESLSDHVLRLMHKGSRALENIRLLLWCKTYGVPASWNLIFGVPGETDADYADMEALLPALRFLDPPCGCGPVRLDRYSAYAERPQDYGLHDVEPLATYRYLYPFPEASLRQIAYAFDYAYPVGEEPWDRVRPLMEAVARWQSAPETGAPRLRRDPDGRLFVEDTRSDAAAARRDLDPLEECVFAAAADIRSRAQLQALVEATFPGREDLEAAVDDALASFLDAKLMVVDGARYLSLALPEEAGSAAYAGSAVYAEGVEGAAEAGTAIT